MSIIFSRPNCLTFADYIHSSEVIGEESALDMRRLHNWLKQFGVTGVGLPVEVEPHRWEIMEKERGLHASGHVSAPELISFVKTISPKILIPVHTKGARFLCK